MGVGTTNIQSSRIVLFRIFYEKEKSLEQKIYEKLGVRSFKKLVIGAVSLLLKFL